MRRTLLHMLPIVFLVMAGATRAQARLAHDIYRYALSDFDRAQQLMNELRNSKTRPEYEQNLIEGDLHFNRGDYFHALNFYKRIIYDRQTQDSVELRKDLYIRIIPCYFAFDDAHNIEYFCNHLLRLATQQCDTARLVFARFNLGRMHHLTQEHREAYRLMQEAIQLLEHSNTKHKAALSHFYRMTLVEYLQADHHTAQAMAVLRQVTAQTATTATGQHRPDYEVTPQMQKDIYAHLTTLNFQLGHTREVRRYYNLFKQTGNNYQYDYKCIETYLEANRLYDDMVAFATARKQYLDKVSVNRNLEYTFTLRLLAEGYMGQGMFQEAARYFRESSTTKRKIIENIEEYSQSELTSVYNIKESELKYKAQIDSGRLTAVVVVALMVIVRCIYMSIRADKATGDLLRKNRAMAKILDESIRNKHLLAQKTQGADAADPTSASSIADDGKAIFDKVVHALVTEKLYLQPDLSRETLIKRFRIPKNKFSNIFTQYAGMTYSQYVNTMKLEHAIETLRLHPNYTIEAVAEECGMSATTLYRLFSREYGMSPTEYRNAQMANSREPAAEDDR